MPRGKKLSDVEQGKILAFMEQGLGIRETARKIDRSHRVVQNFLNDKENYGQTKRTGRKRLLDKRTEARIVRKASNSSLSVNQIRAEVGTSVSKSTVWRTIRRQTFMDFQKLKPAPRLLPRHIEARLEFARNNMNRDWTKVRNFVLRT